MTYQKVTIDRRAIPAGAVESRWTAPDGWALRRIDWMADGAARGSILFMPGRGDIYEKYLETLAHWQALGWNVTSADWRGQGGSGRMTDHQYVGHIQDFAQWIEDIAGFWAEWAASHPGPHVMVGHSMGGHLVARAIQEQRIAPDAAVLSAPMLGLKGLGLPMSFGHMVTRVMRGLGNPERPAWKVSEKPASPLAIRQTLLTHDNDRYQDELAWWAQRPEVVMGPASWHWVERAYESNIRLNAPGQWEKVRVPMLLIGTSADQLVDNKATLAAAARIPGAELLAFGREARHEVLREVDPIRDRVLQTIDDFLARKASAAVTERVGATA
ncbi:alpha/beta fold hydrolase [Sphingomonas sp. 35-24ZXX]|uniref:alpha/beta fold hydrolase n=1 Tax=Sphingomonas sp. 35-24ZXX TaxID=1545915 RepID=UPI00053C014F|nr:alpha/beta hydrolase [Sphingomonas sp. 35-24ZXX]